MFLPLSHVGVVVLELCLDHTSNMHIVISRPVREILEKYLMFGITYNVQENSLS